MHKHVTLKELAMLVEEKGQSEVLKLVQGCDICHNRMKKAESLFKRLREKSFAESEALYKKILNDTSTDKEFFDFIAQAPSARKAEKKRTTSVLRPVTWGLTVLAAACLVVAINFFYDAFLPAPGSIAISKDLDDRVAVTRKGLFFGSKNVSSDSAQINRDLIHARADLFLDTGRGMKLHVKDNNEFSFKLHDNVFTADLHSGIFYIMFKNTKGGLAVNLPGDLQIRITGTEIYFDVKEKSSRFFVNKGRAQLLVPEIRPVVLERGILYDLHDTEKIQKRPLTNSNAREMLSVFPVLDQEVSEHKISVKKLSVITTKQGKKYIGTFKVMGKNVRVITEKGTFMIPSDEIQSLEPYRE